MVIYPKLYKKKQNKTNKAENKESKVSISLRCRNLLK